MSHNINRHTLSIYLHTVLHFKKPFIGIIVATPLAIYFHQVLPPIVASRILDKLSAGDFIRKEVWSSFGSDLVLYGLSLLIGGAILWRISSYCTWKLEFLVQKSLAKRMFDHLMSLDANFHASSFGGSLVSRTNKFLSSYIRIADTVIFQFYTLFIMLCLTGIIMWSRSKVFVLTIIISTALYIFISIITTAGIRNLQSTMAAKENRQTGLLADMITNILAVKSYAGESSENSRFGGATDQTQAAGNDVMRASLLRETIFGTFGGAVQTLTLSIAVISVVVYGADVGNVFLMFYYTNNVTMRLWDFSQSGLRNVNRALGDAEEGTRTLLRAPSVKDPAKPQDFKVTKGSIEFNGVNFSHDNTQLFSSLNLHIKPGEKIGLVGPSGGGKTTITKLLLRFMDIQSGSISIDGQDISTLAQKDLRLAIAYVPQEPLLFHRSLSENIAYGSPDATPEMISEAAKKANADSFIQQLEKGYETLVGERGVKLSGGQKQRIAIARAILKQAPIIILDEATSALDSESEKLIQDALWKLMKDKTTIVIAHRLSTIQKMDRIVVLDNGTVVEEGTHSTLLKKQGHYAQLWQHQTGGFIEG